VKFAVSTDSSVATKFGVSAPAIVLTKKFDEGRMDYAGPFNNLDITEFVTKGSTPNVIEFSPATAQKIFGGELKTHFLLFVDKSQSYYADKRAMLDTFAVEYKGRLLSVIIPSTEDKVMQYFGFEAADLPTGVIVNMAGQMKKYRMDGKVTLDNMNAHATAYFAGSIVPQLKSAEIPASPMDGHVRVLVGKNFNAEAIRADKDVFVEFYAPWCGHCKSLAPKWEELAKEFSSNKNVVIAKLDATDNEIDVAGVEVQGFPTLYFFPAGGAPIKYDGPRETDDLAEFVRSNAKATAATHDDSHDEL